MAEENPDELKKKYQEKGAQKMTLAEYHARQKKAQKPKIKIPPAVKWILYTPIILIFCAGIFFIPYIFYLVMTSPSADAPQDEQTRRGPAFEAIVESPADVTRLT